jgi:Prenyltransferase and squalene oxidase repeat
MNLGHGLQEWLLDTSDPSVRARALTDLLGRKQDDPEVAEARQKLGHQDWVSEILDGQIEAGQWGVPYVGADSIYWPFYSATIWQLLVLSDLGATRSDPRIDRSARVFLDRFAGALGGTEHPIDGGPSGKLCVTGNVVRMMYRFGFGDDPRVRRGIEWLLDTQLPDGGWSCYGSDTTGSLDDWEALAAFAAILPADRPARMNRAIERGLEFYLSHRLSEDGAPYPPWFRLHYPNHYYYDLLVGLDVVTELGVVDDPRLMPALDWLESRRLPDGRWPLDRLHPDVEGELPDEDITAERRWGPYFAFGLEPVGLPSRWITLRALTVLHRAGRI